MTWDDFGRLDKAERQHFHRCNGCGAMVDDRREEEVRQHLTHAGPTAMSGLPREQQTTPAIL